MEVSLSEELLQHLATHEIDGATVAGSLFEGGRLSYPERRRMEYELGFSEPYLLEHEARVIRGMPVQWNECVAFLSRIATRRAVDDPTLELLWGSHDAFIHAEKRGEAVSLDRLIAALVVIHDALGMDGNANRGLRPLIEASAVLIRGLESEGFPPSSAALEEICDGALPACVGLGIVDIDHNEHGRGTR